MVGDRVDLAHPAATAYLRHRGVEARERSRSKGPGEAPRDDIRELLTLRNVVEKNFGSVREFKDWAAARARAAEAAGLEERNHIRAGRLISRELVSKNVFGLFNELNTRLLQNGAVAIVSRVSAAVRSNTTQEQITELVRDLISSELSAAKHRIGRGLRSSRSPESPPEVSETTTSKKPDPIALFAEQLKHRLRDALFGPVIAGNERREAADYLFQEVETAVSEARHLLTAKEKTHDET